MFPNSLPAFAALKGTLLFRLQYIYPGGHTQDGVLAAVDLTALHVVEPYGKSLRVVQQTVIHPDASR